MANPNEPAITIATLWDGYQRQVMPPSAGALQVQETRRAFYAAAYALLVMMRDDVADLPEDQALVVLQGLHDECRAFGKAVEMGQA